jgi:hypothetical protein
MLRARTTVPATAQATAIAARMNGAGSRLVRLYDAWGKPDGAARWRAKLAPTKQPEKSSK